MNRSSITPKLAALIVSASLATLATGAVAYWTASGSGNATTMLADLQTLSFAPGTPTAQLQPGGSASVAIVATNANSYFVQIPSLALDTDSGPSFVVDAAHDGCGISSLSFVTQTNGAAGWSVPPKVGDDDGTLTIDMADALHMTVDAADACQGATFTVRVRATA